MKRTGKVRRKIARGKNWDEKIPPTARFCIAWAFILIWAGLVFLASNLGWVNFEAIPGLPVGFSSEPWSWILVGAGAIILIEVAIRLLVPEYRRPIIGSLFLAVILIGIGLGNLFNWNITGALILIALGLMIIFRGIFRERKG
jgi:hypothetical protein